MYTFEVPVEEFVARKTVHKVQARDADHASEIVRALESGGRDASGATNEEVMRKIVGSASPLSPSLQDSVVPTGVATIVGLSMADIRKIPGPIEIGDLVVETVAPVVTWKGATVRLSIALYRTMLELALRVDEVVDRAELLDAITVDSLDTGDRNVDSRIKRLRGAFRRVDPDFDAIEAIYCYGYRLNGRVAGTNQSTLEGTANSLLIDEVRKMAWFCGELMHMPRAQFELLAAMARRPSMIMDTESIVKYGCPMVAPGTDGYGASRTAIKNIRRAAKKISPGTPIIETSYGIGARIHPDLDVRVIKRRDA